MKIKHFFVPGLSINSYLVFDEGVKCGALIDPTRQIEDYLAFAKQEQITITNILETHVHADFISGAPELKAALGNKPTIHCSGMGGKEWVPAYADHAVKDRESIQIGSIRLEAWHTPGHTPEHLIWLAYDENRNKSVAGVAFTGDALFVGSVGRPDLLGAKQEKELTKQLYQTLFRVLHPMPEYIEIFPAHSAGSACGKDISAGNTSTFGYEKRCNPWFMPQEYTKWEQELLKGISAAPAYFPHMKAVNVKGVCQSADPLVHLNDQEMNEALSTCLIVDIRSVEEFNGGYFKGSIHIPYDPHFSAWAGAVLPEDKEIVLVVAHEKEATIATDALRLVGTFPIKGFYVFNMSIKDAIVQPKPLLDVKELKKDLEKFYILDVRTPREWSEGHIPSAHHLELNRVTRDYTQIPSDKPIAVVCRSGRRASIITSLLRKQGYPDVVTVKGGMLAWNEQEG